MNKNLTEIVLIIDKSSSMYHTAKEANIGIHNLIQKQKDQPGECNITLYEFDHRVTKIFDNLPIGQYEEYKIVPCGSTSLLDAIGTAIDEVGKRLSDTKEEDRPGFVYVAVITDGFENSSKKYSANSVKEKVKEQTEKYSWKFDFIGCEESFLQGEKLGFNSTRYSDKKTGQVYDVMSDKLGRMRQSYTSGGIINDQFTEEEKKSLL